MNLYAKSRHNGRLNLHRFSPRLRAFSYVPTNCLARKVDFSQTRQIATVLTQCRCLKPFILFCPKTPILIMSCSAEFVSTRREFF